MTYRQFDRQRFELLLNLGVTADELAAFVQKHKAMLVMLGAKADNLPQSREKAAKLIAGLPTAADSHLSSWLQQITKGSTEEITPERLVLRLLEVEHGIAEPLSGDDSKKTFRALAQIASRDDCPDVVLRYLRSKLHPTSGSREQREEGRSASELSNEAIASAVAATIDPSQLLNREVNPLELVIGFAAAKKAGDTSISNSLISRLGSTTTADGDLAVEVASDSMAKLSRAHIATGLDVKSPNVRNNVDGLEAEEVSIIGFCSKVTPGARFVEVVGLLEDRSMTLLSREMCRRLLPDSGDAIYFPGQGYLRQPEQDEFGVWKVQFHDVGKPVKYRLKERVGPIYEVVSMPYRSTDEDLVRKSLIARGSPKPGQRFIYSLSDGLVFRLPGDFVDPATFDYERPLDAWDSLIAFKWGGKQLVVGDLPAPTHKYDCSPIASVIRRVIRTHQETGSIPQFSNKQLQEFSRMLEENDGGLASRRAGRIVRELGSFVVGSAQTAEAVKALMETSGIKDELDVAKARVLDEFRQSKADTIAEMERLRSAKEALIKEIDERKDESRRLPIELGKAIKKAFESAKESGISKLSEIAIFQGILEGSQTHSTSDDTRVALAAVKIESHADAGMEEMLRGCGLRRTSARHWAHVVRAATECGFAVAIQGSSAAMVSESLAQSLSRTNIAAVDVPIGLLSSESLTSVLDASADSDVLLLRNANVSPLEVYLRPILLRVFRSISVGNSDSRPVVLMELVKGPTALPVPASVSAIAAILDCDVPESAPYDGEPNDLIEDVKEKLSSAGRSPDAWLSGLASVVERCAKLDKADIPGVLGLIDAGMVLPFLSRIEEESRWG